MDGRRFDRDPAPLARNVTERDLPFEMARKFDFEAATVFEDGRYEYIETRVTAIGPLGLRLHVLVYTIRGNTVWVILCRKANKRESMRYAVKSGMSLEAPERGLAVAAVSLAVMTPEEDVAITAAAEADPEARPFTDEEFARARRVGRPFAQNPKKLVSFRLDADIVATLRAGGAEW